MIKTLFFVILVAVSYCYSLPYQFQHQNFNLYNNRGLNGFCLPDQFAFSNTMSVNDAIRLQQLNNARDSMMVGGVGDIRRSLKNEINKRVAAETMNINNYGLGRSVIC
jgi:hypothetical protein